jgi:hypothetical protein
MDHIRTKQVITRCMGRSAALRLDGWMVTVPRDGEYTIHRLVELPSGEVRSEELVATCYDPDIAAHIVEMLRLEAPLLKLAEEAIYHRHPYKALRELNEACRR